MRKHEYVLEGQKHTEIRLYSSEDEVIYIAVTPANTEENGNIFWDRYDCLIIYRTDYEKLLYPIFDELFPVNDPDPVDNWGIQEKFDPCSLNWFGREDMVRFCQLMKSRECSAEEAEFYTEIAAFVEEGLKVSGLFCINGNL